MKRVALIALLTTASLYGSEESKGELSPLMSQDIHIVIESPKAEPTLPYDKRSKCRRSAKRAYPLFAALSIGTTMAAAVVVPADNDYAQSMLTGTFLVNLASHCVAMLVIR